MKKRQHHQISVPPAMLDRNTTVGSASTNKRIGVQGNPTAISQVESGDIISLNSPPLHMEVQPPGSIESQYVNTALNG